MQELEGEMARPDFWTDQDAAGLIIAELKDVKDKYESYTDLNRDIESFGELLMLAEEDQSLVSDLEKEARAIEKRLDALELKFYLSGRFDRESAIVSINAGAGGTEACDWTGMLFRMYSRWSERSGFKQEIIDELPGEEAGIKNVTFMVRGRYAYGYMKAERGVHRLVRISPFDSNKRRHTSFSSVDVMPEISEDIDIEIKPEELKVDTYRSGGAGGQHVNKTDSAVRITHIPTGIVVSCQKERSQHMNKAVALMMLKSKLYLRMQDEKQKEINALHADKKKIEWGSQIRSYVLHPYLLVKDHRTDCEWSQAERVLDGEIDRFIEAYLKEYGKDEA
jgi:peptide chain release factor 2